MSNGSDETKGQGPQIMKSGEIGALGGVKPASFLQSDMNQLAKTLSNNRTVREGHKAIALSDKPKYEAAYDTLFKLDATKEEKLAAIRTMYHLLRAAEKYDDKNATTILNFLGVATDFLDKLRQEKKVLEANQFANDVGNNKINNADDVFARARNWGYSDWVKQEMVRSTEYTSLISSMAASYASQLAAQQAHQFQMTSTTQQLDAIVSFVEKIDKERKKKEEREVASREEEARGTKTKSKKKKEEAEDLYKKITGGTEVERPLESKFAAMSLNDAVKFAAGLREDLRKDKGTDIKDAITNPRFQSLYEEHRDEELRGALKNIIPSKRSEIGDIMKAGKGGARVDLSKYDILIQTSLVVAYGKALQDYYKEIKKAG